MLLFYTWKYHTSIDEHHFCLHGETNSATGKESLVISSISNHAEFVNAK